MTDPQHPQRVRMPALTDTTTHEALDAALHVDAIAAVEWAYFARIAEIEGHPEAARALRELSEQHLLCAQGHLDLLVHAREPLTRRQMGDTFQNLAACSRLEAGRAPVERETAKTARNEGFHHIASWFESTSVLREAHAVRLTELLLSMREGA